MKHLINDAIGSSRSSNGIVTVLAASEAEYSEAVALLAAEAMDAVEAIRGHVFEAWGGANAPGDSWRVHVEFDAR